jgi:hypothetical protein
MSNYPDDWGTYYFSCGCHAAWGCDCNEDEPDNSKRPWLANSDFEFNYQDEEWNKIITVGTHTCRRDHKDGYIKKGQRYMKTVIRYIDDNTGESRLVTRKYIL